MRYQPIRIRVFLWLIFFSSGNTGGKPKRNKKKRKLRMVAKGAGALFRSLVPEGRLSFAQLGHSGTGWSWMDDLDGEPLQTLKESKKETQHLFCLKGTNISHLGKMMEKDNPLQKCLGRGYVHSQEGIG